MRVFLVFLALFLMTGCASQHDVVIVYDRLVALEEANEKMTLTVDAMDARLAAFEEKWEEEGQRLRSQAAEVRASTDAMRRELRNVQGQLEETGYTLQTKVGAMQTSGSMAEQQVKHLEASLKKVKNQLMQVEDFLGLEAGQVPQAKPKNTEVPMGELDEKGAYSLAKSAYDEGDFDTARQRFKAFLGLYPSSPNADNALFWIGESYFREKWYEKAILEYQKVIEKHPKANKVPAALYKQGMAFAKLGDKSNARHIWKELMNRFPASAEATLAGKAVRGL